METKKAYIRWTHPEHKNRKLPLGICYAPHIVREDDPSQTHWSVCFTITEGNQSDHGVIDFSMLVDNDATRSFFDGLKPNTQFVLLEALTEIARGHIIE